MAEPDPYQAWLDDFKREIESLASQPAEPSREAGRRAQAAFASWWQSELETKPAPPSAQAPEPPPAGLSDRLERLVHEKSALQAELGAVRQENERLRLRAEELKSSQAELGAQAARLKERGEGEAAGLQSRIRSLEEQLQSLRQGKAFVEKAFERMEARAGALEADLRQAMEKEALAQREALEARRRLVELEPELQRLRQDQAAAQAVIAELRRQASSYQERVVDYQDHTGSDVAMLRQELREFLIKVKRVVDDSAGRQP